MIGYISGIVTHITSSCCILMVGGIGYEVHVPTRVLGKLTAGQEQDFFIHTHVREDQLKLYGFESAWEKDMFTALLDVSGIGPKIALAVLSSGSVNQIQKAIIEADLSYFTKIKGLGKKNAQKIIIELKTKLGSIQELDLSDSTITYSEDVIAALQSFGFLKRDIIKALDKLDNSLPEPQLIKLALQQLGKQ